MAAKTSTFSSARVWERKGENHALSMNTYAFMIAFWTAFGIGGSAVAAYISRGWQLDIWFMLGVLAVSFAGIYIGLGSKNPFVSLIGYAMVFIPMGLMLGPFVALYPQANVIKVLGVTTSMVIVLGFVGVVYPKSLMSWSGPLFGALWVLIIMYFFAPLAIYFGAPVQGALTWIDWIGVLIFSAYVMFDMNRAMRLERTHDNAIDSAMAVYLDFANIFIRLLELSGQKSSD